MRFVKHSVKSREDAELSQPRTSLTTYSSNCEADNTRRSEYYTSHIHHFVYGDNVKIAQVAPLAESVPPKLYGGTERVVAYLTDALIELGHDVTLFASGDSATKATLSASWPRALRLDPNVTDHLAPLFMQLESGAAGS